MTPFDFERLCEELYTFTTEQREELLELLQSRIWLYESEDYPEFERIYEFNGTAIKIILRETERETLAYALKGASEELRKTFYKNMSKADLVQLNKKMKALGPVRKSQCDKAKEKILETINALASSGEIESPAPITSIPIDFSEVEIKDEPGLAKKNLVPSAPPISNTDIVDLFATFKLTTAHVRNSSPKLRLCKDGDQSLTFATDEGELVLKIDDSSMQQLGQICAPYAAEYNGKTGIAVFDEARRLQARVLLTLSDRALKLLLREVDVVNWADLLWHINDARLARKVFAFGTPYFANRLMNDLDARRQGEKSDSATEIHLEKGRQALQLVLGTLYQLCDEGQIWISSR